MSMLNSVILTGRLTADPVLQARNDRAFVHCSIATEDGYGDNKHTNFFRLTAFQKIAEGLVKGGVKKGSYIWIKGALRQSVYEKDGERRYDVGIILHTWGYCGYKDKADDGQPEKAAVPPAAKAADAPPTQDPFAGLDLDAMDGTDDDLPF